MHRHLLLLLLPLQTLAFSCAQTNSRTQCAALGDLYAATQGERWRTAVGWRQAAQGAPRDFCTFSGVECEGGSVVRVKLALNKLSGSLPASLEALTALELFSVGFNEIAGSVPASLGSLLSLTMLNLRNNRFIGQLPPQLGSLVSLVQMELGSNEFEGGVPSTFDKLPLTGFWLLRSSLCGAMPPVLERKCSTGATWCPGFPLPTCT